MINYNAMNNIIKLLCSIFASFATVLSPSAVWASTININGLTYALFNENTASVVGVSDGKDNAWGNIDIPYKINYGGEFYTVKYISQYAFEGCYAMTSVTIPGSISGIQRGAFKDCTGLTSVTIPASVSYIEEDAFSDCTGLKKFNINDGTESIRLDAGSLSNCPLEKIYIGRPFSCSESGSSVFCDIKTFFSVTFGQKLSAIPTSAFKDCSTLASVTIPNSVIYIEDYAFSGCSGLNSIAIPNSVVVIRSKAFSGCDGLKEVHISSVESWCKIKFNFKDSNPLYYAHNLYLNGELVTDLVIPESISTLKNYVFSGYTSLTSVTIPNTVTDIEVAAFSDCTGLTSISIPNSVTDIGAAAFSGCTGLTSISIPNSVTEMDLTAFDNLNIHKLIVEDGTERLETIGNFDCALDTLYYGREIINELGRHPWNVKKIIIGNLVTRIIKNAFENWYELTSVIIPNSVTSIGYRAFYMCHNLSSITIPESVTSIESDAFINCFELTSLNIPDAVTSIGSNAFKHCKKLSSIHISSLESWCDISFGNEYSSPSYYDLYLNGELVTDLVIPESISYISHYAFCDCSSLTSVTIPESVTSIGNYAFDHCPKMVDVTIPNSVKYIGENAFSNCYALNSVNIPNSVTSIKRSVFSGCSGLTSITIPESVTSIGYSAFSGCTSINAITVHALVPPQLVKNGGCFADNVYETATVGVPDEKVDDYMADTEWSKFLMLMGISEINPTDVKMENTEINLMESEKTTLKVTVFPENAVDKTLTWHSSNPSVASVDTEGVVTALMKGTAIISATTYNGINATCEVTVDAETIDIERLTLNIDETEILEGETVQLTAVVEPENATDKTVTWSSSDYTIATVDANGLVTGIYPGKVTIAAATANGLTATCDVTILSKKVTASGVTLNIDEAEIFEGETVQLAATVEPENATDKTVTWSSSDVDIAVVDSDGLVTGIAAGTAIIRVSISENPSIFDECVVTVSDYSAGVYDISEEELNVRIVNRAILVEGCSPEATVTLYTLTGLLVRKMVAHDIIINIESVPEGCYILKIGTKAFKIAVP